MPVTITLHDSVARKLEKQAGLRNIPLEQWAVEVLLGQSEAATGEPEERVETWNDEKNARRCELIDRQFEGTLAAGGTPGIRRPAISVAPLSG